MSGFHQPLVEFMSIFGQQIWTIVLQIGSIAGLISLVFTVRDRIKKNTRFKFDFRSSRGCITTRDGLEIYEQQFSGYVKNQSTAPNSITEIAYVVWGNKARTKTLAEGMNVVMHDGNNTDERVYLPLRFEAKEGRHLVIKFDIVLTGSHHAELLKASMPSTPGSPISWPKHEVMLVFKDTDEALFDDRGELRSQKLIDLWWTLPNTFHKLKEGNPLPYLNHMLKIGVEYVMYIIRKFTRKIGLW